MAKKKRSINSKYRSKFEDKLSAVLINAGYKYEPIKLNYEIHEQHFYKPDFVLNNTIIELKGRWTREDRKKIKTVVTQHPEYNLYMVFQNENSKIAKNSKTTYAMWCIKNNINYISYKQLKELLIKLNKKYD